MPTSAWEDHTFTSRISDNDAHPYYHCFTVNISDNNAHLRLEGSLLYRDNDAHLCLVGDTGNFFTSKEIPTDSLKADLQLGVRVASK